MRLITSILVSSVLLISIPGKLQNLGGDRALSDAVVLDNSEILIGERGSGRDEQKQAPMLEQEIRT